MKNKRKQKIIYLIIFSFGCWDGVNKSHSLYLWVSYISVSIMILWEILVMKK